MPISCVSIDNFGIAQSSRRGQQTRREDHEFRSAQNSERIDQFNPIVLDNGICHGKAHSIAVFLVLAWAVGADGEYCEA